jgi:hypothetical protein
MPVGIREVAVRHTELEPHRLNGTAGNILLGKTFDAANADLFARSMHTGGMHQFRLGKVMFNTKFSCLYSEGQLIRPAYLAEAEAPETDSGVDYVMSCDQDEMPVIGFNRVWDNHFHWIAQCLPAIDNAIRRCTDHRPVCILPPLNDRHKAGLRLLGHRHARYRAIALHQRVALSRCEYSELLGLDFVTSMSARGTWDRLAAQAEASMVEAPILRPPLIYVARTDSPHRRMLNEAALIELLERRGFTTITPGSLTLEQQIVVFRNARMVVGPHGAGMANIAFCRPQTVVYELLPRFYANACMNRIAQSGSLIYAADLFEGEGNVREQMNSWFVADLGIIAQRLDELMDLLR